MRKLSYVFLILAILIACSPKEDSAKEANNLDDTSSVASEKDDSKGEKGKEEGKTDSKIEITLPDHFFEDEEDLDALVAAERESGLGEVEKNADGSITYTMLKAEQQEMLDDIKSNTTETIDDVIKSEEFPSIHEITSHDDLSEFTFLVDKTEYESSFDLIGTIGVGMLGGYYQHFNEVKEEDTEVVIQIVDEATDEVFDEIVYP